MTAQSSLLPFDWGKCIFCQQVSRSCKPTCPANSKRPDVGLGYKSLSAAIAGFNDLGQLPSNINLMILDEGDGIEATCQRHRACWHQTCRSQVLHPSKLDRLRVQALNDTDQTVADVSISNDTVSDSDYEPPSKIPRLTRTSTGCISNTGSADALCLFCNKEAVKRGSSLRHGMTDPVDERVRHCATIIGDHFLIGKMVNGDLPAINAKYHPACLLSLYDKAARVIREQEIVHDKEYMPK